MRLKTRMELHVIAICKKASKRLYALRGCWKETPFRTPSYSQGLSRVC
jgi:hypothetical protein